MSRIKSISADLSHHLREYNVVCKSIRDSSESQNTKTNNLVLGRETCLKRIDSIIHHHCDHHDYCDKIHCKYKSIDFKVKLKHNITETNAYEQVIQIEINTLYAKESRFRGSTMNISLVGHLEMRKMISKRSTIENTNKLASILSANLCENYFGILVKYSQGKIINLDQTDSWCVLQSFVAGLRSNVNLSKEICRKTEVLECLERYIQMERLKK